MTIGEERNLLPMHHTILTSIVKCYNEMKQFKIQASRARCQWNNRIILLAIGVPASSC